MEDAVDDMKSELEKTGKDSQDKRRHYNPTLPEDDDPPMMLTTYPATYYSPPSSLIQYPPLTQVCTGQEARAIASMEKQ